MIRILLHAASFLLALSMAGDRTLLDLRSLPPSDDEALGTAVLEVAGRWR